MALSRARRDRGVDYWPGFVDALSTLILGIIFLLTVFVVVQFVLSQEVTGKDTALARLSARISQLTDLLGLEQTNKVSLEDQIAALRRQVGALEQALEGSDKKDKDAQSRLADLGQRLNVALAQRVQELSRFRSDFFGRLRSILGNRPDIRIVGDRFVLQSEVFFDTGQSVLKPEGRAELDKIAAVLLDVSG